MMGEGIWADVIEHYDLGTNTSLWEVSMAVAEAIDDSGLSWEIVLGSIIEAVNLFAYSTYFVWVEKWPATASKLFQGAVRLSKIISGEEEPESEEELDIEQTQLIVGATKKKKKSEEEELYDLILYWVDAIIENVLWGVMYVGPWKFCFDAVWLIAMEPWQNIVLSPIRIPYFYVTGVYIGFAKRMFWDYDFLYGPGSFTLVENPYLTYNKYYDRKRYPKLGR